MSRNWPWTRTTGGACALVALGWVAACGQGTNLSGDEDDAGGDDAVVVVCTAAACTAGCADLGFDHGACRDGLCLCFDDHPTDGGDVDVTSPDAETTDGGDGPDDGGGETDDTADEGDDGDDIVVVGCASDEECPEGFLCLGPDGEYPSTETTERTCRPFDGTFEDGPLVGGTGCSARNLVDTDVWGFCTGVALPVRDGDVVRGSVCGPDRAPVYEYAVAENTRVEVYLSRADESLGLFFVESYHDDCTFRGGSGGIDLVDSPHHGPLEMAFDGGSRGVFAIPSVELRDGSWGHGDFTFHIRTVGTF